MDMLGKLEHEVPIMLENAEGTLLLHADGFVIQPIPGGGKVEAPYKYITSVQDKGELPLGKRKVAMTFYNTMGDKYEMIFGLNELYLVELKRRLGKL